MNKRWPGGILLGVSLALLLAGGVALAQGLALTADQPCFECWDIELPPNGSPGLPSPPADKVMEFRVTGHHTELGYRFCDTWTVNGTVVAQSCETGTPSEDPAYASQLAFCRDEEMIFVPGRISSASADASPDLTAPLLPYEHGKWTLRVCEEQVPGEGAQLPAQQNCAEVSFLFAEDCAAALFVPEPGTIFLLGGGLMGLAGYATLRLRSAQALRRRASH